MDLGFGITTTPHKKKSILERYYSGDSSTCTTISHIVLVGLPGENWRFLFAMAERLAKDVLMGSSIATSRGLGAAPILHHAWIDLNSCASRPDAIAHSDAIAVGSAGMAIDQAHTTYALNF